MNNDKSLLDEMKASFLPTVRFPIQVTGYDVSDPNPLNHRILGKNWLNGESVSIILRESRAPDRKNIADFYSDSNPEAPVTTPVGGIVMVEGAYIDKNASQDAGKVYNAYWLMRIADTPDKGYPVSTVKTLARVHEPKPKDVSDLTKGYKQSITLMHKDHVIPILNENELETLVLDMLDPANSNKKDPRMPPQWKRPGLPVAGIRLIDTVTGDSQLSEMYGGYYKTPGSDLSQLKPRAMIADELNKDPKWSQTKNWISRALATPNGRYKVEGIPMSNVQVAKKTAQLAATEKGRSRTFSTKIGVADKRGKIINNVNGFVPTACCVILSANKIPLVTYAKPLSSLPFATVTGIASPNEQLQHEQLRGAAGQRYRKDNSQNNPAPAPEPKNTPSEQTLSPTPSHPEEKTIVMVANIGNDLLASQLPSADKASLYAKEIGARASGDKIYFPIATLPAFTEAIKRDGFILDIQNTPTTEEEINTLYSDSQPQSTIESNLKPQAPNAVSLDEAFKEVKPVPTTKPVDLSTLNFDDIDMDDVLGAEYESPGQSR
jgi:hypothetical protein